METDTAFWQRVEKTDNHWLWLGAKIPAGTGQFSYRQDGNRIRVPAHAYAWTLTRGPLDPGQMVRQTCGLPACVCPEHLEVYTQADYERWTPENVAARFWARVDTTDVQGLADRCWEWSGRRMSGGLPYGQTTYRSRPIGAHRLAWILTRGPIPDGMVVCHRCDNPPCVRPSHLFLGTYADNTADMIEKDRAVVVRGTRKRQAKFTADQVREIRRRYAAGESSHQLAAELGVGAMTVWRCAVRKSYADVE